MSWLPVGNKALGQSQAQLGFYLGTEVFAHGQFYVTLSRTKDPDKTLLSDQKTTQNDFCCEQTDFQRWKYQQIPYVLIGNFELKSLNLNNRAMKKVKH
jgi:hypothetical protein